MIGLSRLKRAIAGAPTGGMQTGDLKVQLKLCDAQRIEVEYAALISERDAALAHNAELVAQVEYLKSHFNDLVEVAQRCDSWESFPQRPIDRALGALQSMPSQCLRQIQADAVQGAIHAVANQYDRSDKENPWCIGANHILVLFGKYADKIRQGGEA